MKLIPLSTPITVKSAHQRVVSYLNHHGIENPSFIAQNFLTSILNIPFSQYSSHTSSLLSPEQVKILQEYCNRRINYEPLQYIIGNWDFYGRLYKCRQPILIPRPETEHLIERILQLNLFSDIRSPKILDIGCGTGVIGLTLLAEMKNASAVSIDVDPQAVQLAMENCLNILCNSCSKKDSLKSSNICCRYQSHHVDLQSFFTRTEFQQRYSNTFDLIVSNPPYIPSSELYSSNNPLQREVFQYESHVALNGGEQNGLEIIRDILLYSSPYLSDKGTKELWMEVHMTHPQLIEKSYQQFLTSSDSFSTHRQEFDSVVDVLRDCWKYYDYIGQYQDLFQYPRFVRFRRNY